MPTIHGCLSYCERISRRAHSPHPLFNPRNKSPVAPKSPSQPTPTPMHPPSFNSLHSHLILHHTPLSLATPTPHPLQQPIPLRQPIQTIIALAHRADKAAEGIDLVLARVPAILVDFADGDLHAGVVFGFDDAVRGAAFAGDIAGKSGVSGV